MLYVHVYTNPVQSSQMLIKKRRVQKLSIALTVDRLHGVLAMVLPTHLVSLSLPPSALMAFIESPPPPTQNQWIQFQFDGLNVLSLGSATYMLFFWIYHTRSGITKKESTNNTADEFNFDIKNQLNLCKSIKCVERNSLLQRHIDAK